MARIYRKKTGPSITIKKKQEVLTRQDVNGIVKKVMNKEAEWKNLSTGASSTASNTLAFIQNLSPINLGGTEPFQRSGRSVTPQLLTFNYSLRLREAPPTPLIYCRVILYQWKSLIDGNPPRSYILEDPTFNEQSPLSDYNADTRGSYKILYDRRHALQYDINLTGGHIKINLAKKIGLRKTILYTDSSQGDIGQEAQGNYFIMLVVDNPAPGTTNGPIMNWASTIYYTDE